MSTLARDLAEIRIMPQGSLTQHLLREIALNLIAPGVADERGGL